MTVTARELRLEDGAAVRALREAAGMSLPSDAQWRRLHAANPARADAPEAPLGWVLEDGARIVGCFMNIPQRWWFRGKPLRAAATSGWIVEPAYRSSSILLMTRYFSQRGVDLLVNASANPSSSRAFEAFRGLAVPGGAPELLTWVVRPSALAAFSPARVPAGLRALGAHALRAAERAAAPLLRGRARRGVAVLDAPDERFDALWERLRATSPRCFQERSADSLAWLLGGQPGARLVALEGPGGLAAYAALIRQGGGAGGASRFRIVDAQAPGDDPAALARLIGAVLALAFDESVALVETFGFHTAKRRALARRFPLRRTLPQWPFYFRASPALAGALADAGAWDPSPIEGDGVAGTFPPAP